MRIALLQPTSTTTLWLAGDPSKNEREHSSAGDVRINGQTLVQWNQCVRATAGVPIDRGNLETTLTFTTARIFTTVAAAEVWSATYDSTQLRTGDVVLMSPAATALTSSYILMAAAVVQPPTRQVIGCSVLLSYTILGGLLESHAFDIASNELIHVEEA